MEIDLIKETRYEVGFNSWTKGFDVSEMLKTVDEFATPFTSIRRIGSMKNASTDPLSSIIKYIIRMRKLEIGYDFDYAIFSRNFIVCCHTHAYAKRNTRKRDVLIQEEVGKRSGLISNYSTKQIAIQRAS